MLILPGYIHSYSTPEESEDYLCVFQPTLSPYFMKNKDEITFRHEVLVWQQKWHRYSDGREQKYFCKAGCPLQALRRRVWTKQNRKIDESYFALTNSLSMYIQNNFTKKLRLQDIAKQFGYDYSYLSSFFNKNFDMDFASFVNKYRIQFACELLKDTNDDVTQIAMKCGFSTIRNFNRVFKNETGQTPKAYRKLNSSNSRLASERRKWFKIILQRGWFTVCKSSSFFTGLWNGTG